MGRVNPVAVAAAKFGRLFLSGFIAALTVDWSCIGTSTPPATSCLGHWLGRSQQALTARQLPLPEKPPALAGGVVTFVLWRNAENWN